MNNDWDILQNLARALVNNGDGTFSLRTSGGSSSGDVVGPGSATDNAVARFDGTTGKLIQNSLFLVDDSGNATSNGVAVPTISSTSTLTNKRITSRVQSVADAATITPNADTNDAVDITAIAQAFTIANASGTPTNFQKLQIRIKDDGTGRAITWGTAYVAGGASLPSTTIASKILNIGLIYNTANALNKFQCVATAQEA